MIDARSGLLFADAKKELDALDRAGPRAHLLFFDASDDVLLHRYSETRHRHPVDAPGGVQPSIDEERRMLVELRARADKVIDTTHLSVKDLRDTLHSLYGSGKSGMLVHVESFGYKYGLPPAADLVFDVRFMENPFYIPELRDLTGRDEPVRAYVGSSVIWPDAMLVVSRLKSLLWPVLRAERTSRCWPVVGSVIAAA